MIAHIRAAMQEGRLISRRTAFVLGRVGLSLEATKTKSDAELLKIRGLGRVSLSEIRRAAPSPAQREPGLEAAV